MGLTPGEEIFLLATLSRPSVRPNHSFLSGWYEWFFAPCRGYVTCVPHLHISIIALTLIPTRKERNKSRRDFRRKPLATSDGPRTRGCFCKPPPPLVRHSPPHPFVSAPGFSSWTIREAVLYSIYCGERFPVTSRIDRFQGNRLNAVASAYAKRSV